MFDTPYHDGKALPLVAAVANTGENVRFWLPNCTEVGEWAHVNKHSYENCALKNKKIAAPKHNGCSALRAATVNKISARLGIIFECRKKLKDLLQVTQ